jgi:L-ascorbate metabolism protein UlaG (beta-lactamase superfamily)
MEFNNINIYWLGHDGYKIVNNEDKIVYIDPYKLKEKHNEHDADLILISHNHFDHLSPEDLRIINNEKTSIIAAAECVEKLKQEGFKNIKEVEPGQKILQDGIDIEVVPAYNIDKNYHPKEDKKVGFIITTNGTRIYHSGDTDAIPEMNEIKPDIALVPVSGVYVMTAEEAAKAINNMIKPSKVAIPMHYGTIVGTEVDANKFKELVKVCEVVLLNSE